MRESHRSWPARRFQRAPVQACGRPMRWGQGRGTSSVRLARPANSPLQPSLLHSGHCGPRFVQSEPPTRRSDGLARSGLCRPVSPADVQVDGQMILTAVSPTYIKPLNCTSGRDGGIRTRGLLLPKPIREAACHGCGTPDLHSIVRWCPLASSLAAVIVIDLVTRPVRVLGRPGRSTTDP